MAEPKSNTAWLLARFVAATLATAVVCGLLVVLGAGAVIAGVVLLSLVVLFAAQIGIGLALFEAVLCTLLYDYYFLPPYRTLRLAGAPEWVALAAFLLCSLVVGRVSEQARRDARRAEARRADMERLYSLAQEMMLHEDPAEMIQELPRTMARLFELEAVLLYVRGEEQFHFVGGEMPMGIGASLQAMVEVQNPIETLPGDFTATTLLLGVRPVGALAWRPPALPRELAAAVGAQVAILLARATAMEAKARAEAAREGDRLRTALVDSLTHELRTPLTSIRAAATTLRDGGEFDSETVRELAAVVDEESSRLDRLIGEAVEMAQIDANHVRPELRLEHPGALLELAVDGLKDRLEGGRVVIAAEEPDTEALVDGHLLGRVLRHLLENAARYTPKGGRITLRTRRAEGRLEFTVEDEGPGIHPADLPYIFERFYRGKKGPSDSKGTGMGLAIVRSILRVHGGGIEVDSAAGQGARFRFWVPLVEKGSKP